VLISKSIADSLADQLSGAEGELRVVSIPCQVEPIDLVRAGAGLFDQAWYFSTPNGRDMAGLGSAWRASGSGVDRLTKLGSQVARLPDGARVMVGFSFAADGPSTDVWGEFESATAVLPVVSVRVDRAGPVLTVAVPAGSDGQDVLSTIRSIPGPTSVTSADTTGFMLDSDPSPAAWREQVADAVGSIGSGSFSKVVLARTVTVEPQGAIRPFDLVAMLHRSQPDSFAFGRQRGSATFVGASPELLVSRNGSEVRCLPLAGSAARSDDPAEDQRLGDGLLASAKNRSEHDLVVEDIIQRLGPFSDQVEFASTVLRKTVAVQHLATDIRGRLSNAVSVLELADALHPTPAVGGSPRPGALEYIEKVEDIDRGWYAGGIGWTDASGDGEFAVALRCALVRDGAARLYAGAGIMAESDPETELMETRLKFQPLLDLLASP